MRYGALRRRSDRLLGAARSAVPALVLLLALGVPAAILLFSVLRIIPAGHVGVKVLFGQVDPQPLREGLNVVWNPLSGGTWSRSSPCRAPGAMAPGVEVLLNRGHHLRGTT